MEVEGRRLRLNKLVAGMIEKGIQEGYITHWPTEIILVGHFAVADLSAFSDFNKLKSQFDALRRTFVSVTRPTIWKLWDSQRHPHIVRIILRDTMLLAPQSCRKLSNLGEFLKLEKISLPDGMIERMDELLISDRELFIEYAIRDAEIAARYIERIIELNSKITGDDSVPVSLSSIGLSFLDKVWTENNIIAHSVLGTHVVMKTAWNAARKKYITRPHVVLSVNRHSYENLAVECYLGGRNECFIFGASEIAKWTDCDLRSAYPSAMALLGLPDWDALRLTKDLNDFQPCSFAFAHVRFKFPPQTKFPCSPVWTERGLLFPLEGEAWCSAPEIYLAREMGAQLEIITGILIPTSSDTFPYLDFTIRCGSERQKYEKGSLENALWKETTNCLYGKLAQGLPPKRNSGLGRKRCFDSRTDSYKDMPPSKITNPYAAAFVTSFVRASVGEMLFRLPDSVTVASVTTDGFCSTATRDQLGFAASGPICQHLSRARSLISGDPTVWEIKHEAEQVLCWRTRGAATLKGGEDHTPILAMAGLKSPHRQKAQSNAWVVDQFINRTGPVPQTFKGFPPISEMCRKDVDFLQRELGRKISMEFDFKRQPADSCSRPINGIDHLYFNTRPWRTKEDFERCRRDLEDYTRNNSRSLKSIKDLRDFNDYRALGQTAPGIHRPRQDGSLKTAKRQFLRALVRGLWGLGIGPTTYSEIAAWLSAGGYLTKKSDLENAARPTAKPVVSAVPRIPSTEQFVSYVQKRFPEFDISKLMEKE